MPTGTLQLTGVAACQLLLWCCLAVAQGGAAPGGREAPEEPPPAASIPPEVEEFMPIHLIDDEQGKLQRVPGGWTLKDFEELWKLKQKLAQPDQRPRYVLQSISATGTVGEKHADLTIRFTVLLHQSGWVRVPLGFDRALLREPAEYEGPGEGFVHLEEDGEGHVAWIRGPAGKQHHLTLRVLAPVLAVGDETRLKLLAPRATVSQLKLKVPVSQAVGEVSEGADLLESSEAGDGATEFTVLGLAGDFQLTWRQPGRPPPEQPTVLEVEGTVLARIDGRGVDSEATLKVQGSGAPFDRFRVRLPAGASLLPGIPSGTADYSVTPIEDDGTSRPRRTVVEVRLKEKKSGPVEVRLATRQAHPVSRPGEWLELAGFEVAGAARQWGHIDVAAASDWQVLWGASRGVRQVEPLPLEDVVAGFDYDAQPYSLTTRLVPRKTRISVEPEYRLLVGASRVDLRATLKYTIRGAKALKLDLILPPGWESPEVNPEAPVAVDGVAVTEGNVLSIPLLQPSTGKMELQLSAQWPIPEGTSSLVLPLPQPRADSSGFAAVVVVPADNVELTPNHESTVGLTRQPVSPPMKLPDRQQPPLFYRGEPGEAVFAADFRVHPRRIAADVTSRVSLGVQAGQVQQKLAYTIDYEPVDHLTVEVPRRLAESGQLEFQFDGQSVTPVPPPGDAAWEVASGSVPMQIDLPEARIGACELAVQYPLRFAELVPGFTPLVANKPVVVPVSLVMPGEGNLSGNRLYVTAVPEIKVGLRQGSAPVWEKEAQASGSQGGLQLSTGQRTALVELEVGLEDEQRATVVERAWLQTWLTHAARQDRAVFSFTSNQKQLVLVIPAEAKLNRAQVRLDGQWVKGQTDDQGRPVIPLSNQASQRRHLLELRVDFPGGRAPPGRLSVELPRLGGDVAVYEMYWQLVLPRDEHLFATPKGLTGEFAWRWRGRDPLLDQSELGSWVGLGESAVASQEKFAPRGVNRYLFSGTGEAARYEVRTAGRSWIVLCASGTALVVGLLLIYVPPIRHPGTLFTGAVVLLCVWMVYPEPTLLLAQAASLGLALTLLAGFLQRSVAWRRGAVPLESPSAILEKASTQTHYPVPAPGASSSTQTAPVIVPPPVPDSNA